MTSDIGTGGYNTSNYPKRCIRTITQSKTKRREVDERDKGRVFHVSTDPRWIPPKLVDSYS